MLVIPACRDKLSGVIMKGAVGDSEFVKMEISMSEKKMLPIF